MSTAIQRIKVFRDTMKWIKTDPCLSASVLAAKKTTRVFYENDYPAFDPAKTGDMVITLFGDRSFQAAMRLRTEKPDAKIAVMNFANAFHPGGGVTIGCSAQEESLCRASTLYPLLNRRTLMDKFYRYHRKRKTPKASDTLVYTEGIVICKTDEDLPVRMSKDDWVTVDVITIAAPDLRHRHMSNNELFGCHLRRATHMLTCAAAMGTDILVLGAFGCGAFRNDPEVVAMAYKTALREFPKVFQRVEFAVFCRPSGESKNYDVFSRVLGVG